MDIRKQIITDYLGKPVHVIVDRPVGYQHGSITYPINYGYIPNVIAGDGEEQDVYILGVQQPLSEFDGHVIGVIRRTDDCEDKLVAAPMGVWYHQGEIAEAVHFQERYFAHSVQALFQKSCGVIPFRQNDSGREYLILRQTNHCWSFPKGHMESGESETETALRELYEETGLQAQLLPGQRVSLEYGIGESIRKQVVLFFGQTEGDVMPQPSEVLDYLWVKPSALVHYLHPDTADLCQQLCQES